MKIVVSPQFSAHAEFISLLPAKMASGEGELIYDGRNTVARFRHQGLTLVVKRYKQVNIVQQVAYSFFRTTKAHRAFDYGAEFLRRGIDTPEPVAYIEQPGRTGLFLTGFFVSREALGTETHLLLREVQDYPPRLAQAVAQQVALMHQKGILHGDLNLSNFLCTEDGDGNYSFSMIDTNRSRFMQGMPSDDVCLANMVRLTHRRDLYEDIVRRYAAIRQWEEDTTARRALALLDKFERRRGVTYHLRYS